MVGFFCLCTLILDCTAKVLIGSQMRPALLARIYSDTKMNLSRVLWLHDLLHNINPAAVLLSHFSSSLKFMLTFYYWNCSCPQIKTKKAKGTSLLEY